jgi:1-acyl-sn-glycerol-3-phosphate acyltransferase
MNQYEHLDAYKFYAPHHYRCLRYYIHLAVARYILSPAITMIWNPDIQGQVNIPEEGPFIVASNHISLLDPPLITVALDHPVAFMAKIELFNNPFAAAFYHAMGTFALDREHPDSRTIKTAYNVLRSPMKWGLGIFPEGTRQTEGRQLLPFKKGLGAMAIKTQVPVLPIGIFKTDRGRVCLRIGELLTRLESAEAVQKEAFDSISQLISRENNHV